MLEKVQSPYFNGDFHRHRLDINSFIPGVLKTSCDHSYISEGLAIQILPYVLDASPKQTIIAYMRHHIVSYPKVIHFLPRKYASKEKIIQTQDAIKNIRQLPNKRASNFADYIFSRFNSCSIANGSINHN